MLFSKLIQRKAHDNELRALLAERHLYSLKKRKCIPGRKKKKKRGRISGFEKHLYVSDVANRTFYRGQRGPPGHPLDVQIPKKGVAPGSSVPLQESGLQGQFPPAGGLHPDTAGLSQELERGPPFNSTNHGMELLWPMLWSSTWALVKLQMFQRFKGLLWIEDFLVFPLLQKFRKKLPIIVNVIFIKFEPN